MCCRIWVGLCRGSLQEESRGRNSDDGEERRHCAGRSACELGIWGRRSRDAGRVARTGNKGEIPTGDARQVVEVNDDGAVAREGWLARDQRDVRIYIRRRKGIRRDLAMLA